MLYYICMSGIGWRRGFSFIEIVVVIAIVLVLTAISVVSLKSMQERLLLRSAASDIVFSLEAAKARSVAGTGGVVHGVYFGEATYVEFRGLSYDANAEHRLVHELDPRLSITTDILGETSVVFSRITGTVGTTVRITVALTADPTNYREIWVGTGGDIAYGE